MGTIILGLFLHGGEVDRGVSHELRLNPDVNLFKITYANRSSSCKLSITDEDEIEGFLRPTIRTMIDFVKVRPREEERYFEVINQTLKKPLLDIFRPDAEKYLEKHKTSIEDQAVEKTRRRKETDKWMAKPEAEAYLSEEFSKLSIDPFDAFVNHMSRLSITDQEMADYHPPEYPPLPKIEPACKTYAAYAGDCSELFEFSANQDIRNKAFSGYDEKRKDYPIIVLHDSVNPKKNGKRLFIQDMSLQEIYDSFRELGHHKNIVIYDFTCDEQSLPLSFSRKRGGKKHKTRRSKKKGKKTRRKISKRFKKYA